MNKIKGEYWIEVSDASEYFFDKKNPYKVSSKIASSILQIPSESIRLLQDDEVHYKRIIGKTNEWFTKTIIFLKSKDIYHEVVEDIKDYTKFMNHVDEFQYTTEGNLKYNLKQAYYIVENILREHEETGFNEMIPSWYEALTEALKTFKAQEPTETMNDYIEYCEYLFDVMPLLQLHPLKL